MLRYVEAGQDDSLLAGRPVLFLHGSSGSYHQARSVFSRLNLVHHALHASVPPQPDRHDYFSLDFGEEKSAMSGALLLRQAHYANEALRTLAARYGLAEKGSWPGAVIVAHSMGGVVARLLPLLCNWLNGSVPAVYTLGAPHAAPVLVVDEDMRNVYIALSAAGGGASSEGGAERLESAVLLSVSGGVSDFFIEPALTVLPASRTVNSVAHSVPHVQTSIEHQTLCWCRQLMEVVARAIVTDAHLLPQSASPFLHPRGALAALHSQALKPGAQLKAMAVQMHASGLMDVKLSGEQTLLLLEGRVDRAFLCPEARWSAACLNGSTQLVSTSALYRDAAYFPAAPQLPSDEHHVLLSSSPHVLLSSSAASPSSHFSPVTPPSFALSPLPAAGLSSGGLFSWSAYIPAGVDRYFDLSLQLQPAASVPSQSSSVWLHFSSVREDLLFPPELDDAAVTKLQEAQLITEVNVSTLIRYYRRPYGRYATAILFLPPLPSPAVYTLSLSTSYFSYLRSLFLQLPMLPHFLLSAFLLLCARQHLLLRRHQQFPFFWQLLTATPATQVAILFASISLLFALSFAGTMPHAAAFVSGAALPASSSARSIIELVASSSLFTRINSNETGVAGLVVFLACLFLLFAVEVALSVLFSSIFLVLSAARRLLPLAAAPAVEAVRAVAQLLLTVTLAVSLLSHVDSALLAHFGASLSSTLSAALAVASSAQRQLSALFVDPAPGEAAASSSALSGPSSSSVFSLLTYQLPLTLHIALVVAIFLLVQAAQWDSRQPSRCAYQLSCCSLMLLTAVLAVPTFLTTQRPFVLTAPPSSSSSLSPVVSIPALHLVLLAASSSPPSDSPLLQPAVLLLYSFSLLFLHDASLSLQSLLFVVFVLLLCFLPHALHRCAAMLVDAVIAVDVRWGKRARRQHAE